MSCIRAIQGTESALEAYCAEISNQTPTEEGKGLLLVYGVFEALFIQQDAVTNLCGSLRSLNIGNLNDSRIKEALDGIREIRNDIGHPTNRHPPKKYPEMGDPFIEIDYITPLADGVRMLTDFPERAERDGSVAIFRIHFIEIPPLRKKQKMAIMQILDDILRKNSFVIAAVQIFPTGSMCSCAFRPDHLFLSIRSSVKKALIGYVYEQNS